MNQSAKTPAAPITQASRWRHPSPLALLASLWQLLLLGVVLLALIWGSIGWEAHRTTQAHMDEFQQDLMRRAEALDTALVRQLQQIDDTLLLLRGEYADDEADLIRTINLLRYGPLKGLDIHVTVIGRDGYAQISNLPDAYRHVYLGDQPHFRFFASGGVDKLHISGPVSDHVTERGGMQLARPIRGSAGEFLGTVVIFLPHGELTRLIQPLVIGDATLITIISSTGTVLSRSKDSSRFFGNQLAPETLAMLQRNTTNFTLIQSPLDHVERGWVHRWINVYPLLLVVSRTPDTVYAEIGKERRLLFWLGSSASLIVLVSLVMVGRSLHRRKQAELLLQREHDRLAEAQRMAQLGSWEVNLATDQIFWSDEAARIFEMDKEQLPASYDAFLNAIHPDDREAVDRAYSDSLQNQHPYGVVHRLRMSDGRIKWVREQGTSDFDAHGKPSRSVGTMQDITERRLAQLEREALQRERLLLLESTGEGIYGIDPQGNCSFVNQTAAHMLGYEVAEMLGQNIHALIHHQHADGSPYPMVDCPVYLAAVSGQLSKVEHEVFWRKDGTAMPVNYTAHPIRDADKITGAVVTFSDITQRIRAEAELRIAETAFQTQESIFVTDKDGVILRINNAFTELTGYTAADIVGKNPHIRSSGRHDAAFYAAMWKQINHTGTWKGEIWNRRKDGAVYPESLTITAVKGNDASVTHYVATMHDITARKAAEEHIRGLAFFDPLTHLPNRRLLQDRLQQAQATSSRSKKHGALLFIDLDKFKVLNDTFGHNVGDLLLQQVAQRLLGCVREADTVARLGGDEFVVLLEELSEQDAEARIQTASIGQKILDAINLPYDLAGHRHHSTPSIGATLFNNQQHTVEELIKQADLAMYQVKASGRNALRFFEPVPTPAAGAGPV
jgi:diguanylate cyclase (GGDEF)-like protein/PAS domain S-box-containing protein